MSASSSSRGPAPARRGLLHAVTSLSAAQQRIGAAALVVLVSLGTPWYSTQVVFRERGSEVTNGTMSGIRAFSFVEAGVLLVAAAVLVLVWARATGRRFSLPAGDGTVVTIAAGWLGLLIVYRLFDRPDGSTENGAATLVGLSWGIFASLAAVGLLLATGLDQRRRETESRVPRRATPEGPVLDPRDLGGGRGPRAGGRDPERPAPTGASRVPPQGARSGDVPVSDEDATRVSRGSSSRPGPEGPSSRSWAFDDPDRPHPPEPPAPSSPRRPTPPRPDAPRPGDDDGGRPRARRRPGG